MVKQKTRKAAAKRFRQSKRGKVLRRYSMQDHYNVRHPKRTITKRRRDRRVSEPDRQRMEKLLPFSAPTAKTPPRN